MYESDWVCGMTGNIVRLEKLLGYAITDDEIIYLARGMDIFAFILTEHFVNTYKTKESIAKYILSRCPPNRLVKYSGIV